MTQHDDGRLADARLVIEPDQAAERGLEVQHPEVAAGHERAATVGGPLVITQIGHEVRVPRDAGEHLLTLLEIAEHRVRELSFEVADREIAVSASDLCGPARRREIHELLRLRHRKWAQENLVVKGKHRRRRADPEREHHDHDGRQSGTQP